MTNSGHNTLWILSELYYPEDSATGYNLTKVAEALAENFHVRVLCAQPTYKARGIKAPTNEIHEDVQIHRCAATALNKDVILFRLVNLITVSLSIFFNALVRIRKNDIALVVTNPPTLPFVVILACKLRGAKLVLRVEDVYPEAMVATGMAGQNSSAVKVFGALSRLLYKKVDMIIALGRDMKQLILNKIGNEAEHVTIITNYAEGDQIVPLPRLDNPLLKKLGLIDKFVLQYSGNMGRTHDIESLVECAKLLQTENHIHFLFIGWGAKEVWLREAVRVHGLENVTVLPSQPREDLVVSLNACDLTLISFVSGMSGVSVPSRMYNIMAVGKPIIAIADMASELAQVVEEEKIGWVVMPERPALIAEAIREASSNRILLNQMSTKARILAVEKYSQANSIRKYESLMLSMGLQRSAVSSRILL